MKNIVEKFAIKGEFLDIKPLGHGLINGTFMKKSLLILMATLMLSGCRQYKVESEAGVSTVLLSRDKKFLLLPIQEDRGEVQVRVADGTWMDVRLAVDSADYYVPLSLDGAKKVEIAGLADSAATWKLLKLSDSFDTTNKEYYRPEYHFTPTYGWMNDPNGMTYLDGEYHLFFQYNPYGSKWGNMHWGHAVSEDLVHWTQLEPAIARDDHGHIFSGSSYIARLPQGESDPFTASRLLPGDGTEGDFIASYYTTHSNTAEPGLREQQSFAVSLDHGRTYKKYGAPVLRGDGRSDFRDPKLFWNEQRDEWGMIVSADNEMQFYASSNLREWKYVSAFGDGYGVQPRQFECPDFFKLPLGDGEKWVMIVNVNPGCWFGGSASQYFTGSFDGDSFVCDSPKETVKWLDWGKDHYAAVTFSCEPKGRVISIPWMSNWQYANDLPTRQYRSQMGMPRELFAFQQDGSTYVGQRPVAEMLPLASEHRLECEIADGGCVILGNTLGEKVVISCHDGRIYMDRTKSGIIPSPDFETVTWIPVAQLCGVKPSYQLEFWLDKCSIELFVEGGKASMTNLVYPSETLTILTNEK